MLKQIMLMLSLSGTTLAHEISLTELPPIFSAEEQKLIQTDKVKMQQASWNLKRGTANYLECGLAERDYYLCCLRLLKAKDEATQKEHSVLMQDLQDKLLSTDTRLLDLFALREKQGMGTTTADKKIRIVVLSTQLKELHWGDKQAAEIRQALHQACADYLEHVQHQYQSATCPYKAVQDAKVFVAETLADPSAQ